MPRLVGRKSNTGVTMTWLLLFAVIAVIGLEWYGVLNLVSNVGRL